MKIDINSDIEEIMSRVNLMHVRSFIFDRKPVFINTELENLPYEQRLNESTILLSQRLKKMYKDDENELDDAMSEYETAISAYSEVYAEIGMKIGAKLLFQLLLKDE